MERVMTIELVLYGVGHLILFFFELLYSAAEKEKRYIKFNKKKDI